jgi:hypothetical protein
MRIRIILQRAFGISAVLFIAACGSADNPYARLKDPPLVLARPYTVTLASDSEAIAEAVSKAGFTAVALPPNYQQADAVEASIWGVAEPVAARAQYFKAASPNDADIRLLMMPLAARGRTAEPPVDQAFFRNVLGGEVPRWPLPGKQPENVRVQVWGYLVPDILVASKRLRENGIPVIYDAVSISTSYSGTHKTLAIRAPDGTVVQLVEATAQ